jgi:hypothetical protein
MLDGCICEKICSELFTSLTIISKVYIIFNYLMTKDEDLIIIYYYFLQYLLIIL